MAGKKQHFIWQHIQRGFASKEHNDFHVWVYRKNLNPERTVTKLHGYEKFFYGDEGSLADANITKIENGLSKFVAQTRTLIDGAVVDAKMAGLLVSKLELRSSYLRSEFSRILERCVTEIKKKFLTANNFENMLRKHVKDNPDEISKEAEKAGLSAHSVSFLVESFLSQQSNLFASSRPEIGALLDDLAKSASEISKNAHIKSLQN